MTHRSHWNVYYIPIYCSVALNGEDVLFDEREPELLLERQTEEEACRISNIMGDNGLARKVYEWVDQNLLAVQQMKAGEGDHELCHVRSKPSQQFPHGRQIFCIRQILREGDKRHYPDGWTYTPWAYMDYSPTHAYEGCSFSCTVTGTREVKA